MSRVARLLTIASATVVFGQTATATSKHVVYPRALRAHWAGKLKWCAAWSDHDHDGLVIEPTVASAGELDGELISIRRLSPRQWKVVEDRGDATDPDRRMELYALSPDGRHLTDKALTLNGKAVTEPAGHYFNCERSGAF